jgi:hypothetical protein
MSLGLVLDGGIAGLLAGLFMILSEVPFWRRLGIPGVVEWQVNEIMASRLFNEPYNAGKKLGSAILMHLFHGMALGILFTILVSFILPTGFTILLVAGLSYSLALWLFVPFSLRRVFERAGRTRFTQTGMIVALLGHLVYGLALGGVLFVIR